MEITSLNIKRNLVKLYIISCIMISGIMGFAQNSLANPIAVPPRGYVSPPPADSSGSDLYMVMGGVIVVVMLLSLIILLRLRKKSANK